MKTHCLLLLLAASFASCQRGTTSPNPENTLVGSWRLTAYLCNCPPGTPVPNETVTFDNNQHFTYFRNQAIAAQGTYTTGQGTNCGGGTAEPIITLTPTAASTYVPKGAYTLEGNTLVIDQCSAADGPRYTYTRQ
jgi:hypothetical protein